MSQSLDNDTRQRVSDYRHKKQQVAIFDIKNNRGYVLNLLEEES